MRLALLLVVSALMCFGCSEKSKDVSGTGIKPSQGTGAKENAKETGSAIADAAKTKVLAILAEVEDDHEKGTLKWSYPTAEKNSKLLTQVVAIGEDAVPSLIQALKDKEEIVRVFAAGALGLIGDSRAEDSLIAGLSDSSWRIRDQCALSLEKLKSKKAAPRLLEYIEGKDAQYTFHMISALVELAPDKAIAPLIIALSRRSKPGQLPESYQDDAIELLPKIGKPAITPLKEHLKSCDKFVRVIIGGILYEIGDSDGVKILIQAIDDEDRFIPEFAMETLAKVTKKKGVHGFAAWKKWYETEWIPMHGGKPPPVKILFGKIGKLSKDDVIRFFRTAAEEIEKDELHRSMTFDLNEYIECFAVKHGFKSYQGFVQKAVKDLGEVEAQELIIANKPYYEKVPAGKK